MKKFFELLRASLRSPTFRLLISFAALMAVLKLLAYGWAVKALAVALVVYILLGIFGEWRKYLPSFRRRVFLRIIRFMRALRPLRRLPPEVPVLYGAVVMYMIFRVGLVVVHWSSPLPSTAEASLLEAAVALGAVIHAQSILIRAAKWSWSKTLGKAVYVVATSVCVAVGLSEATRTTRLLAHADAKYFPSFVGLLSSWYTVLSLLQCLSTLLFICAFVLLLVNLPSFFLRGMRGYMPFLPQTSNNRLLTLWRRVRFGRNEGSQRASGKYLRDIVEIFTPFALMMLAAVGADIPSKIMNTTQAHSVLEKSLVAMEYTADEGCPNVTGNLPTVHLEGDFVSVATVVNDRLQATRQSCHMVSTGKS